MTVHCPHCATGYLLPDPLVGERGARVRCPTCNGSFVVIRENGHATHASPPEPARSASPTNGADHPRPPAPDPTRVAAQVLDAFALAVGPELEAARAEGRLLSRHGPALLDAYDEYRRRSEDAGAAAFVVAIRDRWGLDLVVGAPPENPTR